MSSVAHERAPAASPPARHPVDELPPLWQTFTVGLQHVLVMYAGAIAVPLIIGGALNLPKDQVAFLINADLFCCGIATLIQTIGFWKVGIRLPVMMGVTFAAVGPMSALAAGGSGPPAIFGATIVAGAFAVLIAPAFSRLLRFFPPVVTGTIIAVIGITLLQVGTGWAGGGKTNPEFGAPGYILVAFVVLAAILCVNRYLTGFLANVSVLIGLVVGFLLALPLGMVSLGGVAEAPWLALIRPFAFGPPTFEPGAVIALCLVMLVVLVESTGMFLALGEITGRPVSEDDLTRGLRTDGLGSVIGGVFNTFPHTSISQNVGLIGMTGVRSRWVVAAGGVILVALGLLPKLAVIVASIPVAVLGGAGIAMFGMVAATGVKILGRVDFDNRNNLLIVAVGLGVGMIPMVAPTFFEHFPSWTAPFTHSGITLTAAAAVLLNAFLNGAGTAEAARAAH